MHACIHTKSPLQVANIGWHYPPDQIWCVWIAFLILILIHCTFAAGRHPPFAAWHCPPVSHLTRLRKSLACIYRSHRQSVSDHVRMELLACWELWAAARSASPVLCCCAECFSCVLCWCCDRFEVETQLSICTSPSGPRTCSTFSNQQLVEIATQYYCIGL